MKFFQKSQKWPFFDVFRSEITVIWKTFGLNKSKWNFLNFKPGLVGGHCLPVDPYYLSNIAKKNYFNTEITLAGRKINDGMLNYVIRELSNFLNKKNKFLKNSKIMIVGLTYKAGVADMRNSLNFKIFKTFDKFRLEYNNYNQDGGDILDLVIYLDKIVQTHIQKTTDATAHSRTAALPRRWNRPKAIIPITCSA